MPDVRAYLEEKGHHVKDAPGGNVHTHCFFHDEDKQDRGRLYINVEDNNPPGLFTCFVCGETGAFNKLRKWHGDPALDEEGNEYGSKKDAAPSFQSHKILQSAAQYYHELLMEDATAYRYLTQDRGLTPETIAKHKLGWADGSLKVHLAREGFQPTDIAKTGLMTQHGTDFFYGQITIPYHSTGSVVQIRGKEIGGKYLTPSGQKARLFNPDAAWGSDEVCITEGEFDAMVLTQLGFPSVGVPGATSWQEDWNRHLERAKRVFLVFDNDDAGHKGAEKTARVIGPRSRIVTMPKPEAGKPKVDPTEFIVNQGKTADDFRMLLIEAKGGSLVSVDDAVVEWVEFQGAEGLKLGIEAIDAVLEPGLLPSQLMVVNAKTGTGKTVFLLNLFQRMKEVKPDIQILFVSLEQTRGEWFERARRIHRFYNPQDSDVDVLDAFRENLMMLDDNRVTEEQLIDALHQFEFERGRKPDLVAIDYLGYWARSFPGDPYQRTSDAVMSLKAIAKDHRIPIISPHQVSRTAKFGQKLEADQSRDSGAVEETADFLFGLWADDQRSGNEDEKTGHVTLKIMKSRHGGVSTQARLQFAPQSLAMVPMENPDFVRQAVRELDYVVNGENFDQVMYRHSTGDVTFPLRESDFDAWLSSMPTVRGTAPDTIDMEEDDQNDDGTLAV